MTNLTFIFLVSPYFLLSLPFSDFFSGDWANRRLPSARNIATLLPTCQTQRSTFVEVIFRCIEETCPRDYRDLYAEFFEILDCHFARVRIIIVKPFANQHANRKTQSTLLYSYWNLSVINIVLPFPRGNCISSTWPMSGNFPKSYSSNKEFRRIMVAIFLLSIIAKIIMRTKHEI